MSKKGTPGRRPGAHLTKFKTITSKIKVTPYWSQDCLKISAKTNVPHFLSHAVQTEPLPIMTYNSIENTEK